MTSIRKYSIGFRLSALLLWAALLVAGCGPAQPPASLPPSAPQSPSPPTSPAAAHKPAAEWTANEILQTLLATYRQAATYQDQGVVRLAYRQAGQPFAREWPVAVAFQRPNKLSLVAYQATVKCDGSELRATIEDRDTANIDGQVLVRPAPRELKLTDLAGDALLYDILSSQLRRQPVQLELLIESGGLMSALGGDVACQRQADERHEGRQCFRVEVPSPGGPFVFWVDQENLLLRRLDYPAAALVPDLARDPAISDLQIVADLRGAVIGGSLPSEQFALALPPGAKQMKSFVRPPRPLPSSLFGKTPAAFHFTDLRGSRVQDRDLAGKIAVLAWYHDNPAACAATLQQVSLAYEKLKDESGVAFYAVATDPAVVSGDALQRRLTEWDAELPIVRDLDAVGDSAFKIEGHPAIVVLDPQGRVQIFQVGGNPQLGEQIVMIVQRLKQGDDLAAELLAGHDREWQQYEQLVARGGPEPEEVFELPEAAIRRKSEPKQLKLQPLWTCRDLAAPGNMLVVEATNEQPRIYVCDGWQTIVEIDAAGRVAARHPLEIPEQAAVTFLRTAADRAGRRYFAGSAPLSPQLFLFDDQWKLLLAWPPPDQTPLAVVDLALADVGEADGTPEMVSANVADLGLVAVSLAGDVLWRNRAFPNAVSLALTPPDDIGSWALLVTGESGGILRVNRFGNDEPPVTVGNWPILRLLAARSPGRRAVLLGLSSNAKGEPFAVGLTRDLKESWNYPLPPGAHHKPIEPVVSSRILPGREGEWWLAGPDGSIHLVTEDGELFDSFHYGAALSGLAATRLDGRPVLLVATDQGLDAWEIAAPQPPRTAPGRER